ncbi:MAG: hypothetical protein L0154_12365 [Chloroflexi bacterium]|nr:hypothetical protein [Chloroflexota bacterium]
METIIVQISDHQWTMEATHLACALARRIDGNIVLLRCVLANNPGLLGWGVPLLTNSEYQNIKEYTAVAEDYGVEYTVQPMQFISLMDALAQATQQLDARVLFAHIPRTRISLWRKFRLWQLRHQLHNCYLYTVDEKQPLNSANIREIIGLIEEKAVETPKDIGSLLM